MKELLKELVSFILMAIEDYPFLTSVLFLILGIYFGFFLLPKKTTPKFGVKDYGYYGDLFLTFTFTLICFFMFIIQALRLIW